MIYCLIVDVYCTLLCMLLLIVFDCRLGGSCLSCCFRIDCFVFNLDNLCWGGFIFVLRYCLCWMGVGVGVNLRFDVLGYIWLVVCGWCLNC